MIYAILLYEELATENEYNKRLNELFLSTPENDDLFNRNSRKLIPTTSLIN